MPFPLPVELVRKACIIFISGIPEEVSGTAEFEFCIPPDELVVDVVALQVGQNLKSHFSPTRN